MANETRPCAAPCCQSMAAWLSEYCSTHTSRLHRNGHPLQSAVSAREIAPFVCSVVEAIDSRQAAGADPWQTYERRWAGVVDAARTIANGTAGATREDVSAARAIVKTVSVGTTPAARGIVANILALVRMRETMPERFADDRAFVFQVARRFLTLNRANAKPIKAGGSTIYPPLLMPAMERLGAILLGVVAGEVAN